MLCRIGVLDTETTGLNASTGDRVCDFGATILSFRGTKLASVERKFQTLINPGFPINPLVSSIHHITDRMVKNSMTYDNPSEEFMGFMQDFKTVNYLGSYNLRFDWDFMVGLYPDIIQFPEAKRVCYLKTLQKFNPNMVNHQLQYVRYALDLEPIISEVFPEPVQAHRAFSDVVVTSALVIKLLEQAKGTVKSWGEFFDLSSWGPGSVMCFGKHKGRTLQDVFDSDRKYVTYLFEQDWFKPKYTEICNVFERLQQDEQNQTS